MLDFPASPTVGQQFTAAGVTWTFDGTKWTASGLGVAYLPLTGGTLTGNLTVDTSAGPNPVALTLNAQNLQDRALIGRVNNSQVWKMSLGDATSLSSGNVGVNFSLTSYDNVGAVLATPLTITRSGQVTIPNLSAPQAIGDNRILNPDMRIDQRNNGAASTAFANGAYTIDRWKYISTGAGQFNVGRNLGPPGVFAPGFPYCLGFGSQSARVLAAGDTFGINQPIEADMVSDLAWGTANAQPVTLSFWALSNQTGTFSGSIRNADTSTRSYPFTFSLPTAGTWTKIAVNIPGDTAGTWAGSGNGQGVQIAFDLGSGATFRGSANAWTAGNFVGATGAVSVAAVNAGTFYVTGVKLEIGSVATPYNRQSLTKSLADCQRYYQTGALQTFGYAAGAGNAASAVYPYPVVMRASPTLTPTWTTQSNGTGSLGVSSTLPTAFYGVSAVATGAGNVNCSGTFTASVEL
jgi:hypothetical protein